MSADCLFCGIVDGEIPGRIVYEDDDIVAFLDVNPLARGHTLVVSKPHRERVNDLEPPEAAALFRAVADVVPAVEAAVDAPGSTVAINNGEAAGQEVPHLHVHVVPRWAGDGAGPIHGLFGERPDVDDAAMDDIEAAIGAGL
jgi:histidine triad (HIT) family protein